MKLLFVNSSLTGGGSERALLHVAEAMADREHSVTMVLLREKERTYQPDDRIRVVQLKYGTEKKIPLLFMRLKQLRSVIRSNNFDFIVCYMWDLNIITLLASLGLRKRIIVSERAFPGASSRSIYSKFFERLFYRFAYKIIYQTEGARSYCYPELVAKAQVVPNIIVSDSNPESVRRRDKRIVSAGRLSSQKNFPLLIRSFAKLFSVDNEWKLEIYGQGPLLDDLNLLVQNLGISDSVSFPGYVDDISERFRNAGMFVLTSDFEGISNAMTEAMSLGLPCICTDCPVGGAALLIDDGVSGLLVPVGGESELTDAMLKLASNYDLGEQLSIGARNAVQRFAPDALATTWESDVFV